MDILIFMFKLSLFVCAGVLCLSAILAIMYPVKVDADEWDQSEDYQDWVYGKNNKFK